SSAPLAEKSTSQQDAAPKKEQPKVAEPPKTAEPTKVEFEEKQGKRGVKLGTVAIILSIIFGGGLAYKLHQQQADYQAHIAQLKSQLESTQASMKQELSRV
ncbi:uroporphyrinogen-III C-methyltransferase, partial [Vibrio diabolicus]